MCVLVNETYRNDYLTLRNLQQELIVKKSWKDEECDSDSDSGVRQSWSDKMMSNVLVTVCSP